MQLPFCHTLAACLRAAMPPSSLCRELLLKEWVKFITGAGIPMSPGMNDPLKVGCVLKLSLKVPLNASVLSSLQPCHSMPERVVPPAPTGAGGRGPGGHVGARGPAGRPHFRAERRHPHQQRWVATSCRGQCTMKQSLLQGTPGVSKLGFDCRPAQPTSPCATHPACPLQSVHPLQSAGRCCLTPTSRRCSGSRSGRASAAGWCAAAWAHPTCCA